MFPVPLDYADPRRQDEFPLPPRKPWPHELRAVTLVLCSFIGGACLMGASFEVWGFLASLGVLSGIVWYVLARVSRRKGTRLVWKVQLVAATLLCMFAALTLTGHSRDLLDRRKRPWYIQNRPLYLPWLLPTGVGWFVAVEIAAAVERRLRRRSSPARLPQGASE